MIHPQYFATIAVLLLVTTCRASPRYFNTCANGCGWRLDSNADGSVYISTPNNGAYQLWNWNNDLTITDAATGLCLDSNGYYVNTVTATCNGGNYQKWRGGPNMGQVYNVATNLCLVVNKFHLWPYPPIWSVQTQCCSQGDVMQNWSA
ncbi:Actinohivin [Folsomia candida]|uniref:Actinohivin n=1 Tax=Folsomia candida TaxID=158441 RepID=A0A226D406_FOLCA|nr:Actinohivin [Folsomia candida]